MQCWETSKEFPPSETCLSQTKVEKAGILTLTLGALAFAYFLPGSLILLISHDLVFYLGSK